MKVDSNGVCDADNNVSRFGKSKYQLTSKNFKVQNIGYTEKLNFWDF